MLIFVRKIREKDILNLVRFLIKNGLGESLEKSEDDYYICMNNDIVCGSGSIIRHGDYCIIKTVMVDEDYRRRNIGSAIVKTMLNSAELAGATTAICLGANDEFSKRLGFQLVSYKDLSTFIRPFINDSEKYKKVYIASLVDYFKECTCQ